MNWWIKEIIGLLFMVAGVGCLIRSGHWFTNSVIVDIKDTDALCGLFSIVFGAIALPRSDNPK